MKHSMHYFQNLLLGGLLATAGVLAQAQANPVPADSFPGSAAARSDRDGPGREMRGPMHAHMQEHQARHLDQLKAKLKLSPAQEGAWETFKAAMQAQRSGPGPQERERMERLTTPERVDRMNSLMSEHQGQMRARGEAAKAFYAVLSEEQKKVFDREALPRHPHRGRAES